MPLPVLDPDLQARLETELRPALDGELRTGRHDRMLYSTDASIYQVEPMAVVIPASRGDVLTSLAYAARHALPILARGGGTSLAGQTVNRAIVLDTSRHLTAIRKLDADSGVVHVEPGVVLDDLNAALAAHGRMFGPDVATSTHATLGGMIGNNSAGAHSVLFGRTVEHLRGLEVALADGTAVRFDRGAALRDRRVRAMTERIAAIIEPLAGEIDARFPRTRRRVDGYNLDLILAQLRDSAPDSFDAVNLAHLVCGSEGTLAFTLEAELDTVPRPRASGLAIVAFESVDAALDSVAPILELTPAAVELVDDIIIDLAGANRTHRATVNLLPRPGGVTPKAVLYVEFFADGDAELDDAFDRLRNLAPLQSAAMAEHRSAPECDAAWRLRKAGEPLLHGQPGSRKPVTFVEDTAVPPERLPEFVRAFRALLERHDTYASYFAHASVGCLHIRPMIALAETQDRARMVRIMTEVTDLVLEYGGALSGEHGDGRLRSPLLEQFYGPKIVRAFGAVKAVFDPEARLNPGNIVDPAPVATHLRIRPGGDDDEALVSVPETKTWFRYEREHGFGAAVEMCNGAGLCRRTNGGTMCPSYRATRDERQTTRGRGNALRLAITGQGGTQRWNDAETLATLDLCLSCKACKSECPSNVDIARLKSEYLAHSYRDARRVPRGVRAMVDVRRAAALAARAPGLAQLLVGSGPGRAFLARALGVDRRRSLPAMARSLCRDPLVREAARLDGPTVVLFGDCFTAFGEPAVGRSAVQTLTAMGYRVVVPKTGCCARPHLSLGVLEDGVRTARSTLAALESCVERERAVAVVGCEPSCVSAIVDDWPDLAALDPARSARLAAMTSSVEDFVEGVWDQEAPHPPAVVTPHAGPLAVHGHCHQKATGSLGATARLLERICPSPVDVLDTGCCGMAGAFGMTRDHYDISVAIAESELLPALRARPDATFVAPGTSCRHQVRDLLQRPGQHPIEIVAAALRGGTE